MYKNIINALIDDMTPDDAQEAYDLTHALIEQRYARACADTDNVIRGLFNEK